jgi:hypothetical protein
MNRTRISVVVAIVALAFTMSVALPAFAANVSGMITEASGKPVRGVTVIAQNQSGQTVQTAVSGQDGSFAISGLGTGGYRFAIDPGKLSFKSGAPVAAFVSDKGLTLNWVLSPNADPIALAKDGVADQIAADDPFGFTWPQLALLGGAVAIGGAASGVAAVESSSGSESIASSSK